MEIKDRLQKCRKEKGISQKEAADILGISKRAYESYERGERDLSTLMLLKICTFYGVSSDYMLGRSKDVENKQSSPPIEDEQEALFENIRKLDDKSIKILEEFIDYLLWKSEQG
ncbi:MAG: helix-turn-helix transcriptional regulator [Ruminiclostridium sp.]|nr:helix-turn-helix transcriptional regulator [Ruminiclostridium sp.]